MKPTFKNVTRLVQTTPVTRRHLALARSVGVGLEVELYPLNRRTPIHAPKGWTWGWDADNAEFRTPGILPLSEQAAQMKVLHSYMRETRQFQTDEETGFHVHVNIADSLEFPEWEQERERERPKRGATSVDGELLAMSWAATRSEAELLVVNRDTRRSTGWCDPVTLASAENIPIASKEDEITLTDLGSIEFRLWDASPTLTLSLRRLNYIKRLIATAFMLAEQKGTS